MNKFIKIFSLIIVAVSIGVIAKNFSKTYSVVSEKCIGCELCESVCPNNAIKMVNNKAVIDVDKCNNCGECVKVCPTKSILLFDKKEIKSNEILNNKKSTVIGKNSSLEEDMTKKPELSTKVTSSKQKKFRIIPEKEKSKKPETSRKLSREIIEAVKKIYSVESSKCIACKICVHKCPVGAIQMINGKAVIDVDKCIECGICENVCPTKAISHHSEKKIPISNRNESDDKCKINGKRSENHSQNKKKEIDKRQIIKEKNTAEIQKTKKTDNKFSSKKLKENKNFCEKTIPKKDKKNTLNNPSPKKSVSKKINEIAKKIFSVDKSKCIACKICVHKCPVGAIQMINGKAVIDVDKCIECGICENVCPTKAISHHSEKKSSTQSDIQKKCNSENNVSQNISGNQNENNAEDKVNIGEEKVLPKSGLVTKIKKKINYLIYKFKCVGCEDCVEACPVNAIKMINGKAVIDQTKCISCGKCVDACTYNAIEGK